MTPELKAAIDEFPLKEQCQNPDFCQGNCDNVSYEFLKHAEMHGLKGILLALDNPRKTPTTGWKQYGGHWRKNGSAISHYVAYFPTLQLAVDWTARQFWHKANVPLVKNKNQIEKEWEQRPFGWQDARKYKNHLAGTTDDNKTCEQP